MAINTSITRLECYPHSLEFGKIEHPEPRYLLEPGLEPGKGVLYTNTQGLFCLEADPKRLFSFFDKISNDPTNISFPDRWYTIDTTSRKTLSIISWQVAQIELDDGTILLEINGRTNFLETVNISKKNGGGLVDKLSGLFNQTAYHNFITDPPEELVAVGGHCLILDLDKFKVINDTEGHAAGDEIIKKTGEILKTLLRETDPVCRRGGDEFAAVLIGTDDQDVTAAVSRLQTAFEEAKINISIGCSPWNPADGQMALINAMNLADKDLYQIKEKHHAAMIS